eukprot:TRINITY_DN1278_c0_g4_i1.p1 TRINITY_DN1278_c0_g4~~TRINITY_DN1278_c0_g4_i1.p1  ORF type:complete len:1700 (+),score=392.37 TRINITY_DN1278_c0_g4_i1:51-5102(+)
MGLQRGSRVLRQVRTVLHKNAILKVRSWAVSLVEVLFPVVLLLCLVPVWSAVGGSSGSASTYGQQRSAHNSTEVGNALKCRKPPPVNGITTEYEKILAYPPCEAEHMGESNCIGDLCVRLPTSNDTELYSLLSGFTEISAKAVPDYDLVALARKFAVHHDLPNRVSNAFGTNVLTALSTGDKVVVVGAPEAASGFREFLKEQTYCFTYNEMLFASEESALRYAVSRNGSNTLWGLVKFTSKTDFTIRMNRTSTPPLMFSLSQDDGPSKDHLTYFTGFTTLQDLASRYVTNEETIAARVVPMPIVAYSQNRFLTLAGDYLPLLLSFGYLCAVTRLVGQIVHEKETKVCEAMLVMGLSPSAFKASWVITGYVQAALTSILMVLVVKPSFYNKTDSGILFCTFWLYAASLVGFCIALSVFFSKLQPALICTPIFYMLAVLPTFTIPRGASSTRKGLSLLSTFPFNEALYIISHKESHGHGLTWAEAGDSAYSLTDALGFLVVDNVLYLFLAWYFDRTLPAGVQRPWYSFFWPPAWFRNHQTDGLEEHCRTTPDNVSEPSATIIEAVTDTTVLEKCCVVVSNLWKVFKTTTNGRSEYKAAVKDVSMSLFEGQIQVLLGHNGTGKTTLINMMTGMIPITSGSAAINGHSIVEELQEARRQIGLCPQQDVLWNDMTCGEHLQIYAKLKGLHAKEVTAAVDTMLHDVGLWDKKHVFAKELSGGMKKKLSVAIALIGGSKFVILDEPTAGMDVNTRRSIWKLLKSSKANRTILMTTQFMDEADILGDSIAIMHDGCLHCQGSSPFLRSRLGAGYTLKVDFEPGYNPQPVTDLVTTAIELSRGEEQDPSVLVSSCTGTEVAYKLPVWSVPSFPSLFDGLEAKGCGLGVNGVTISLTTLEEIYLGIVGRVGGNDAEAPWQDAAEDLCEKIVLDDNEKLEGADLHLSQWRALITKRFRCARRDCLIIWIQIILPVLSILFALLAAHTLELTEPDPMSLNNYSSKTLYPVSRDILNESTVGQHITQYFDIERVDAVTAAGFDEMLLSTFNAHGGEDRCQGLLMDSEGGIDVYFNQTYVHSVAVSFSVAVSLLYGNGNEIHQWNHPLPFSEYFKEQLSSQLNGFIALFVFLPFAFIPVNFINFVVMERESGIKQAQLISGVRRSSYWGASYLWDIASLMLTVSLVFVVFAVFKRDEYIGSAESAAACLLLFVAYGASSIGMAYLGSFYIKTQAKAQTIFIICGCVGFVLITVMNLLTFLGSTRPLAKVLRHLLRPFPLFALGDALVHLATLPADSANGISPGGAFHPDVAGLDLIFLSITAVGFAVAAMCHDFPEALYYLKIKRAKEKVAPEEVKACCVDEDADVAEERKAVEVSGGRSGDIVTVQKLRKEHHERAVVKDVSFGVKADEVFALLGTNGAGKTTLVSVLSGEAQPTSGAAMINTHSVVEEATKARRELGYCPQYNALLDVLTVEEHLELFAGLRGVPANRCKEMTNTLCTALGLGEHRTKRCGALSGGCKRMTLVAIALLGGPCVLLDEPSTGMDPLARRRLWAVLQSVGSHRCVLLTTHHLEEAEAVANRMAVMVSGTIQSIGTLRHLKTKYGDSYELQVKMSADRVAAAHAYFKGIFPEAVLLEDTNSRLMYKLPAEKLRLSQVFKAVAAARKELQISDYSVTQTSLEQVFMAICREAAAGVKCV